MRATHHRPFIISNMHALLQVADLIHIASLLFLIVGIVRHRNAAAISYRSQQIFLLVFLARFSDMLIYHHPFLLYLVLTRSLLIATTLIIIYLLRLASNSYDEEQDSFPHYWLYLIAAAISSIFPQYESLYGYLWTFSLWAEAAAILPQYYMLEKTACHMIARYVTLLSLYRLIYLLYWVLDWPNAKLHSLAAALLQVVLYGLFIYRWALKRKAEELMSLPL